MLEPFGSFALGLVPDPLIVVGEKRNILWVNSPFEELSRYSVSELCQRFENLKELIVEMAQDSFSKMLQHFSIR